MEFEAVKLIWNSLLTIAVAVGGILWKSIVDKIDSSEKKLHSVEAELVRVKVDYVQKEEIHRIEQRIDNRFAEIKVFFTEIVRKTKNDLS